MKTIDDFKKYYDGDYKLLTNNYNDSYSREYSILQKKLNLVIVLSIIIFVFLYLIFKIYAFKVIINILFFLIYNVFVFLIYKKVNSYFVDLVSIKINKLIYKDIFDFIICNNSKKIASDKRISKEYFKKSRLFNLDKLEYNGENFVSFLYDKDKIIFSDIFIYNYKSKTIVDSIYRDGKYYKRTITRKIPREIYKGLYIEFPFHKENNSFIYVISNDFKSIVKNRINSYLSYFGERVELENMEFEKQYNVYSDNQVQARYILSLSLMEKIAKINDEFDNKKCIVFRPDGKVSLFIEDYTIDKILHEKIPCDGGIIPYNYYKECFNKLNSIIRIYNILND